MFSNRSSDLASFLLGTYSWTQIDAVRSTEHARCCPDKALELFATVTGYRNQSSEGGFEGRLWLKQTESIGFLFSDRGR